METTKITSGNAERAFVAMSVFGEDAANMGYFLGLAKDFKTEVEERFNSTKIYSENITERDEILSRLDVLIEIISDVLLGLVS